MNLLSKSKKYFNPWFVFVIGHICVIGVDSIIRLIKPRVLNGYYAEKNYEYSVAIHGLSEGVYFLLIYLIIGYSLYLWFKALNLYKWKTMDKHNKIKKSLIFGLGLLTGFILHFYILLFYVLETGIDSL